MVRKVYRSMQGKIVDMELLYKANELVPAVGNARMNARGDELGPGGKIIRKREEIAAEYYDKMHSVREEQFKRTDLPTENYNKKEVQEEKSTTEKVTDKKEVKNEGKANKTNS